MWRIWTGITKKLEKDKYFVVLKYKSLEELEANRFSLLEEVKTVNIGNEMKVTLSIGIGVNGSTYAQNYEFSRIAIELALGRGGDQAVVKDNDKISYYGGKSQQMEKSTRVKARVKAHALREFIGSHEDVVIMGHKITDIDSFGAAVGVWRAARILDKKAHIVLGDINGSIRQWVNLFLNDKEYPEDMFVTHEQARKIVDHDTVVVVVDTNRPSMTECSEILNQTRTIVVLDHHRQSSEVIKNAVLSYIEPYASSACEMIAEILQYFADDIRLKGKEADCIYAGIIIDTNNFMAKTGVRTFEAAAFLRRCGADVTRVRKMFRNDMSSYKARAEAVRHAEVFEQNYGISWNGKTDRNDWQLRAYMSKFDWDSKRNQKVIKAIPGADRLSKMAYGAVLKKQYNTYDFNYNFHNIWAIDGRNTISLNEHHRLTFGSEYVRENISGTDLGVNGDGISELTENGITKNRSRKSFSTYAGYIQNEMEYGKWFIVPAIRYDHHSIYGSHASPKLGVTYSANENFRVKANYGKGFKAPTVFQLFYDLDRMMGTTWVHLTGNSNLKPEESTSWDLGIEAKFGKGYGSITYFDSDVNNLINSRFVKIENNGHRLYRYENVNTARIKGVESTLGYKFNDVLEFKVTSTWLNAKDTTKHIDLTQRAKLSQVYQFIYDDHKDKGWSAMLWNQFDYKFVTDANGDGMPDDKKSYSLTSFVLTRKINKDTRIYGTVQNVFGKKDTNCDLDGRFWSIGWEHTF